MLIKLCRGFDNVAAELYLLALFWRFSECFILYSVSTVMPHKRCILNIGEYAQEILTAFQEGVGFDYNYFYDFTFFMTLTLTMTLTLAVTLTMKL